MNTASIAASHRADVRATLRNATADLHRQVDTIMPLSRSSPSLHDYRDHLQLLALWVGDLAELGVDRARLEAEAHAIEIDLHECTRLLGAQEVTAMRDRPANAAAQPPSSAAFRSGARYVMEGSRLGATFLHRRLATLLAPHPLGYLSGAGWMRQGAWHEFLGQLQLQVTTPPDIFDACEGAKAAFRLLLQRCADPSTCVLRTPADLPATCRQQ